MEGSPVHFEEGKFPSVTVPPPTRLNACSPLAPFSSTPWACGAVALPAAAPPLSSPALLPDGKVSVALTRPLDLRSCSQNNPLASPASFNAGGVFQIGLLLQTLGAAGGTRKGAESEV